MYIYTYKNAHIRTVFILHSLCKLQNKLLLFCFSEISNFTVYVILYILPLLGDSAVPVKEESEQERS